jgi:2-C-methyl-D-erythritol 4-phosphate cytidylyltransferase
MKKILLLSTFVFISIISFSQTKRIAHRSHSGKDNSFNVTAGADNFGLPVPDSIKAKNKNKNKSKTKPVKDSLPAMPVKDTLKTVPANSIKQYALQEQLVVGFFTAKKMFNL